MVSNDEIIRSSLDDSSLDDNSQQLPHFQQQGKFLLGHIHADTQADIAGNKNNKNNIFVSIEIYLVVLILLIVIIILDRV